jgi:Bacterial alpha-L-rhamnosidase 6 hairpin glycosidase domain
MNRREKSMIRSLTLLTIAICCLAIAGKSEQREIKTPYYSLALTPDGSAIASLSVDSLGRGDFKPNALFAPEGGSAAGAGSQGGSALDIRSDWQFKFSPQSFQMVSTYRPDAPEQPIALRFNPDRSHATLLAMVDGGQAQLPALLHLPDQGSLRIEVQSREPVRLQYEAHRRGTAYVLVLFPGATQSNPRVTYTFTILAIYPHIAGIESDSRFDGFRRNWLNIFQVQAEDGALANNSASDPCAFVQHMYSEVAKYTPPLASGLTAMDLVRMSLDRYLHGMLACGMPYYRGFDSASIPWNSRNTASSDTYPSLLTAAGDYVTATRDTTWLKKNYAGLQRWTEDMLATDTNGDGLVKFSQSGDSGSWTPRPDGGVFLRPANWWDTIGFGYEDAYSNALAYHALEEMVSLAQLADRYTDADRYAERATKLKRAYVPAFLDPETGVLAGWRSQDGKLHDYWFPWVNGAAIVYGLVPSKLGNEIFDRMLAKMKEVGYTNFKLGLPGNLVPIRREDWEDLNPNAGAPKKADGSDGFQIYENGGATAAFAYYTIAALYRLGRVQDGDRILFPMLKTYNSGGFQGHGPNGRTYDWQMWNGTPRGYEGLLTDCFMAMAAVVERSWTSKTPRLDGPNTVREASGHDLTNLTTSVRPANR